MSEKIDLIDMLKLISHVSVILGQPLNTIKHTVRQPVRHPNGQIEVVTWKVETDISIDFLKMEILIGNYSLLSSSAYYGIAGIAKMFNFKFFNIL